MAKPFTAQSDFAGRSALLTSGVRVNTICAASSHKLGQNFTGFRDNPEQRFAIFTTPGERMFPAGRARCI